MLLTNIYIYIYILGVMIQGKFWNMSTLLASKLFRLLPHPKSKGLFVSYVCLLEWNERVFNNG